MQKSRRCNLAIFTFYNLAQFAWRFQLILIKTLNFKYQTEIYKICLALMQIRLSLYTHVRA